MSTNPYQPIAIKCPCCGGNLQPPKEDFAICPYCGSSLVLRKSGQAGGGQPPAGAIQGVHLRWLTCEDREGAHMEVFRMLAPVGWDIRGGVHWLLDNVSMPAVVGVQVYNPQGAEAFEIFPNLNFFWNPNFMMQITAPQGSRSFGAEVQPPVDARTAFHKYVLPRYRGQCAELRILKEEAVPELPKLARSEAPLMGGTAEGVKTRISYTYNGFAFEEEIYGITEVFRLPIGPQAFLWYINFLFSFRAAASHLDSTAKIFGVMVHSFKPNPQWAATVKSVSQWLIQNQIQRIHHIGQIGEIIARTGGEMREQNLNDWYARQDTYDRLATDWSRTIRDMDGFYDPHRGEVVELPSGYGHAWANNLGEYIVTEDPNFNPNVGDNLHWEPMEQK